MGVPLPVSDDHHFIGLDQLLLEEVHKLEILLCGHSDHGIQEDLIVRLREFDSREKIWGDAVKQGDVVGQELGKIDVNDGPQQLRIKNIQALIIRMEMRNILMTKII